jgi:hypothetical protein
MSKEREKAADRKAREAQETEQQVDPGMLAMQQMNSFEDRRFLVQTVAVGKKDPNGMRELTFPISPLKQISLVLAPELCDHIMKEFAGGIEVADLSAVAAVAAEKAKSDEEKD